MKRLEIGVFAGLLALALQLAPQASPASFIDSSVQIDWRWPNLATTFSSVTTVVGAGVEFPETADGPAIDIGASSIVFFGADGLSFVGDPFNGFIFADIADTIPNIIGVSIGSQSGYSGFDLSRISFTANEISVDFQLVADITDPARLELLVQFGPVPEPVSGALAGLALAAAGFCRKRKVFAN